MKDDEINPSRKIIDYKKQYADELRVLSDEELAVAFNKKVRIKYFNVVIAGFMNAMSDEMARRNLDISQISVKDGISYASKIHIADGKVCLLNDVDENES